MKNKVEVSGKRGVDTNFSFLIWKNMYINGNNLVKRGRLMIQEGKN